MSLFPSRWTLETCRKSKHGWRRASGGHRSYTTARRMFSHVPSVNSQEPPTSSTSHGTSIGDMKVQIQGLAHHLQLRVSVIPLLVWLKTNFSIVLVVD
jgi:hypothetical protein